MIHVAHKWQTRLVFFRLSSWFGVLLLSIHLSMPAAAQQTIEVAAKDGFRLSASTWKQDKPSATVLLLHQCDSDQAMYSNLAKLLFERGFNVLTFDYRGYGKSVNDEFNLARSTNKRALYEKLREHDRDDLEAVFGYCNKNFGDDAHSISVLGASCGGDKVLYLANKHSDKVAAYGIFSSRMSTEAIDRVKTIADKPGIFIAAEHDRRAFDAANSGFALSSSKDSMLLAYKGTHHGNALFRIDPTLEQRIADWFVRVVAVD